MNVMSYAKKCKNFNILKIKLMIKKSVLRNHLGASSNFKPHFDRNCCFYVNINIFIFFSVRLLHVWPEISGRITEITI